jgi:hypothetical protein
VSADQFVTDFVAKLRAKAGDLRAYGAADSAVTCERNAQDLEDAWRAWWLTELPVSEAAEESGYTEDGLREMVREGKLPARKGAGAKGHVLIPRCHLPRRPTPPAAAVSSIEERLFRTTARR